MVGDAETLAAWMLLNTQPLNDVYVGTDRRAHKRHVVDERGQLAIPSENLVLPCSVVNVSQGGAKVVCDAVPLAGTRVILIFGDGNCHEAVTTRYADGELGLQFVASAEPR
jgi:hypothetical protein